MKKRSSNFLFLFLANLLLGGISSSHAGRCGGSTGVGQIPFLSFLFSGSTDETGIRLDETECLCPGSLIPLIRDGVPILRTGSIWVLPDAREFKPSDVTHEGIQKEGAVTLEHLNPLGLRGVTIRYRTTFTAGIEIGGKGRYLSQVLPTVESLEIGPGYSVDADVVVREAMNTGTRSEPVVMLELQFITDIHSWTTHRRYNIGVNLDGRGGFKIFR